MKKTARRIALFIITAAVCLSALSGCAQGNMKDILIVDGKAVPFETGEKAVKRRLKSNYCRRFDFTYPDDVDESDPVVILAEIEDSDDYTEIYNYELNTGYCDLDSHDITLLGYDGLGISLSDFEEDYAGKYLTMSSYEEPYYELIYAGSSFTAFASEDPYSSDNTEIIFDLRDRVIKGELDCFISVYLYFNDEGVANQASFAVTVKK
jgi:hypothetical protein